TAAPGHGLAADCEIVATRPTMDVARLTLRSVAPRDAALERLRARRTIRSGHHGREISSEDVKALGAAARLHDLHFFGPHSHGGRLLAEATLEANRIQTSRDDAQAELAEWIRWTPADGRAHRNGFTPEALEITGVAGWYVRHFMNREAVLGRRFRKQSLDRVHQQLRSYGGWVVITSPDEGIHTLIDTGRRCERMWLEARP